MSVTKEPCPRCRQRKADTRGDNLIRFEDGGGYCFACGHVERATRYPSFEAMAKTRKEVNEFPRTEIWRPTKEWDYLHQFLTEDEISRSFVYDTSRNRAVLRQGVPTFYWGRSAGEDPKVLSFGEKEFILFGFGNRYLPGFVSNTLVIVEDPVSAIAVGRVCTALPLFGTEFPTKWYQRLAYVTEIKRLVFWLDDDAFNRSLEYTYKFSSVFETSFIRTPKDPKEYSRDETSKYLNLALDKIK